MSDTFPFTLEYEDCMMKVQSNIKAPEDVGIGCGNAFGGGEEDTPHHKKLLILSITPTFNSSS